MDTGRYCPTMPDPEGVVSLSPGLREPWDPTDGNQSGPELWSTNDANNRASLGQSTEAVVTVSWE